MHPLPSNVHVDAALSSFSIGYQSQEFVAAEILPYVPVTKQSDYYYIHGKEHFDNVAQFRAPASPFKAVQHKYSNAQYQCLEYGLEEPVDTGVQGNADPALNPMEDAAALVTNLLLLGSEIRCATEIFTTNPPTTNNALSGTDRWDDAGSDPVQQIETDRNTIVSLGGLRPNRLFMDYQVLSKLKNNSSIKDRIKYGGLAGSGGLVTLQALANLFEVDQIVVGRAVKNTAAQGQTSTLASVWGKVVLLFWYPGSTPGLKTPAYGIQPVWTGGDTGGQTRVIERYRNDQIKSEVVRARWYVDELVTGKDFAAARTTVIS